MEVVTKAGWDKIVGENGVRILTQSEIDKLNALNIEADGNVAISGTINAANVHGLGEEVVDIVTGTGKYTSVPAIGKEGEEGYVPPVLVDKLNIEKGAQVNKIEAIALPDAVLAISNKQVNIPAAVAGKFGVIKGGDETVANEVSIGENGIGKVTKVSTDSLVNGELELVLNGGKATGKANA
jgi:predicted methyltransferase